MVNSRLAVVIWIGAIWGCAAQPEPILTPVEVKVPIAFGANQRFQQANGELTGSDADIRLLILEDEV